MVFPLLSSHSYRHGPLSGAGLGLHWQFVDLASDPALTQEGQPRPAQDPTSRGAAQEANHRMSYHLALLIMLYFVVQTSAGVLSVLSNRVLEVHLPCWEIQSKG